MPKISAKEAAYLLGITDQALRKRRWQGRGPKWEKAKNGWVWYERTEVEAWISNCSKRRAATKTCAAGGSQKS